MFKKLLQFWCKKKEEIHENGISKVFYNREIWFASLGVNIGYEQNGKGEEFLRPVIILKKLSPKMAICIPLTTREKIGTWYFSIKNSGNKKATASLGQIRTIYVNRLSYKIGKVDKSEFYNLKKALGGLLEI